MNTWEDLRLRGLVFLIMQYFFTYRGGQLFFLLKVEFLQEIFSSYMSALGEAICLSDIPFLFSVFLFILWVSAFLYHLPLQQVRTDNSCQRCGLVVYRGLLKLDRGLNKFGQELHMILRAFPTWHLTVVCTCPGNHFYLPCPHNASFLLSPSHTQSSLKLSLVVLSFFFYAPFSMASPI